MALRRLPFLTTRLEGAAPAWSAGLAAQRRIGPIVDRIGRNIWIDIFRRVRQLRFVRSPGAPPLLDSSHHPGGMGNSRNHLACRTIAGDHRGSLWFANGLFAAAPANVYSGVRISRGSLRLSADTKLDDDEVVVPASVSIDLTLEFDPPAPETPAAGSEFAGARCRQPKGLDIAIRAAGGAIAVRGDAELRVWGSGVSSASMHSPSRREPSTNSRTRASKPLRCPARP